MSHTLVREMSPQRPILPKAFFSKARQNGFRKLRVRPKGAQEVHIHQKVIHRLGLATIERALEGKALSEYRAALGKLGLKVDEVERWDLRGQKVAIVDVDLSKLPLSQLEQVLGPRSTAMRISPANI